MKPLETLFLETLFFLEALFLETLFPLTVRVAGMSGVGTGALNATHSRVLAVAERAYRSSTNYRAA